MQAPEDWQFDPHFLISLTRNSVEILSSPGSPILERALLYFEVSLRPHPLVLLITVVLIFRRVWSIGGMILTGEVFWGGKLSKCHFVHKISQMD